MVGLQNMSWHFSFLRSMSSTLLAARHHKNELGWASWSQDSNFTFKSSNECNIGDKIRFSQGYFDQTCLWQNPINIAFWKNLFFSEILANVMNEETNAGRRKARKHAELYPWNTVVPHRADVQCTIWSISRWSFCIWITR